MQDYKPNLKCDSFWILPIRSLSPSTEKEREGSDHTEVDQQNVFPYFCQYLNKEYAEFLICGSSEFYRGSTFPIT